MLYIEWSPICTINSSNISISNDSRRDFRETTTRDSSTAHLDIVSICTSNSNSSLILYDAAPVMQYI